MFEQFKNPDGKTYNGIAAMSTVAGIPQEELAWMARRIKELTVAGIPRADISAMVKAEAKEKPWEVA